MSNTDYIEKMVTLNDFIYADTSLLMDFEWLSPFLEKADPIFKSAGKQIIIPPAVRSELIRHLDSEDCGKKTRAEKASQIVGEYKDLFLVTGGLLDDEQIADAFADAELLATLMVNRRGHRQLLIANDKKLSSDAFDLNGLQSCQGSRISVCHVNRYGELQCCDCVQSSKSEPLPEEQPNAEQNFEKQSEEALPFETQTYSEECADPLEAPISDFDENKDPSKVSFVDPIEKRQTRTASRTTATESTSVQSADNNKAGWKWILAVGGGAAGGYTIGKYGQVISTLLKTALKI